MIELPPPTNVSREFQFTVKDFELVCKLIYDHAGISLGESKQALVYSRLSRRLRATGMGTFAEYLELVQKKGSGEWEAFTNALTTNLTAFFREAHHFPLLAEHMRHQKGRKIALWCAASSTGEEPYSMAMTAMETFNSLTPPVMIVATDLDTRVLATARAGVYPQDRINNLSPERVKRFFLRGTGKQAGMVRVRPELQNLITFRQLNLLDNNWPLRPPLFDAIFCRNVMIYFDKDTQLEILKKFVPLMLPDGLMFAGHSESFYHASSYFKLRGKTVYELSPNAKAQRSQAT